MRQAQQRALVLWAVRGCLHEMGINPVEVTAEDAHVVLDELARRSPDLVASQWYHKASDRQLALFYADWQKWVVQQQELLSAR